ncbi:MAG: hypothetical protein N4A35_04430 [Flavobacteriales bacterium]|nr:hypothetical protein [Flavobacteriales bacterium]
MSFFILLSKHKMMIRFLLITLLLLITSITFFGVTEAQFISWDDPEQVTNNQLVTNPVSYENTVKIFNGYTAKMYQPLTTLVYHLLYTSKGANPIAFHLLNLSLHLINIILVFFLFTKLLKNEFYAIIVASIFALHPMQVEAVSWISCLSTLLSSFFYLLAILLYYHYTKRHSILLYSLVLIIFTLALYAKVMAVSLPLFLVAIDYFEKRKFQWNILLEKIPFLLSAYYFSYIAYSQKKEYLLDGFNNDILSIGEAFFVFPYQLKMYIQLFINPTNISTAYEDPVSINIFGYSLFLVLGTLILFKLNDKHRRNIIFGIVLFIIAISPTIKIKPIGHEIIQDRYFYLAILGLAFLITYSIQMIKNKLIQTSTIIITISFILWSSFITIERVQVWQNTLTIWEDAVNGPLGKLSAVHYSKGVANFNAGIQRQDHTYIHTAILDLNQSIKLDSRYWKAYVKRGFCYWILENKEAAIKSFNQAKQLVDRKQLKSNEDLQTYHELITIMTQK